MKPDFRFSQRSNHSSKMCGPDISIPLSRFEARKTQLLDQSHKSIARMPSMSRKNSALEMIRQMNSVQQDQLTKLVSERITKESSINYNRSRIGSLKGTAEKLLLPDTSKRVTLFVIMGSLFIIQTLFLNVEAILPTFVEAKYHGKLNETHIACIMM